MTSCLFSIFIFFFFNDTATTEIYTLSLHDALPIFQLRGGGLLLPDREDLGDLAKKIGLLDGGVAAERLDHCQADRKSTRLNSSHSQISYAVFCLKKKK